MNRENNQNVKPFAMFVCSLLPGCAHMYMGLMKRGIQMMLTFLLAIGFAATVYGLEFILVPLIVVIYVYSFFDGYSIYRNIKAGKVVDDENMIEGLDSLKKVFLNGYWIGVVLVVMGLIVAFQNMLYMSAFDKFAYYYNHYVERFIPAGILLFLGVFLMIKGNYQRKKNKEQKKLSE